MYIPLSANEDKALKVLHDMILRHENSYPDAAFIITGDFKHCILHKHIHKLHQLINFPTRGNN